MLRTVQQLRFPRVRDEWYRSIQALQVSVESFW